MPHRRNCINSERDHLSEEALLACDDPSPLAIIEVSDSVLTKQNANPH